MPTAVVISNPRIGAELGHLGTWLDDHGFTVHRLIRDDVLPLDATDGADVVILLGSVWTMSRPMTRADDPSHAAAAIAAETALVQRRVEAGTPLLGICFGGQLLSSALGGQVSAQGRTHVAWETPDTAIDELRSPWMLLHNDAFTVPDGAEALAVAHHAPVAFRAGSAWGLQFHPEVDADILDRMFADVGTAPDIAAPYVEALRGRQDEQRAQSLALFDRFWAETS